MLHYGYPIGGGGDGGRGGIPDWYEKLYESEIGPIPREDRISSVASCHRVVTFHLLFVLFVR